METKETLLFLCHRVLLASALLGLTKSRILCLLMSLKPEGFIDFMNVIVHVCKLIAKIVY